MTDLDFIHSFDIFDTVLTRIWAKPTDLFWELGDRLKQQQLINISPDQWLESRIRAEQTARQKTSTGEIELRDIYCQLQQTLNWSEQTTAQAMEQEIELERCSLYPVLVNQRKIQALHQAQRKVAFLSDMYLPADVIRGMLIDRDLWAEGDMLYVSGTVGINKASGELFRHYLAEYALQPSQLYHTGDNLHSDIQVAQKLGIKTEPFLQANLNRYESKIAANNLLPFNFRSLLAGASRLTRLSAPAQEPNQTTIWDTSANVVAPVLFGFVHWCLMEARKNNIQRLYFVARDGQILQKIAQVMCKNWGYDLDCRYLYGSRQAWHFPAILEIGDTELDWIFDPTQFLSVRSVCERVNLIPTQIVESLEQFEFDESMWDDNLTVDRRNTLRQVFIQQAVVDLIVNTAKTYREQVIGYFRQEGMGDSRQFAIVDIGWHGRLQRSLSKLLTCGDLYPQAGLVGFYFGLTKRMQECSTDRLYAYFADVDVPSSRDSLSQFRVLFELFMTADHGGTMKFDCVNGTYVPVLRYEKNHQAIEWGLLTQQQAICEFTQQLTQHLPPPMVIDRDFLLASEILLQEFFHQPSLVEAQVYGSFLFAEDQAENILYQLAPAYTLKDWTRLVVAGKQPHHNIWFPAAKTRSNFLVKLLLDRRIIAVAFRLQALKHQITKYFANN